MNNKETFIIDCDGVLYDDSCIGVVEFVKAIKKTASEFSISDDDYAKISEQTKANSSGLFNFVYALCDYDEARFDTYAQRVADNTDYSKIERNDELLKLLKQTQKHHDIVILTNNTKPHLEKVIDKRFGCTIEDFGIECYDIKSLKKGDKFYPKQTEIGLKLFTQILGKHPSECTLVDDTKRNLDVAQQIGMGAEHITENNSLQKFLLSLESTKSTIVLPRTRSGYNE